MRRVVSLFLPTWPTDRLRRQRAGSAPPREKPLVLAARDGSRRIVASADVVAQSLGITPGLPLAQAQARVPNLIIEAATPEADVEALARLGIWALRYSPIVALTPPDGLIVDVTGAAHLLGGEAPLLSDLIARLGAAGIAARAALAGTVGAAHALARFDRRQQVIVETGGLKSGLDPLPVAALRLDSVHVDKLQRLGFDTIRDLEATPRAPLALRFGSEPGRRLDQAFGRLHEPIAALTAPESIEVARAFVEPIATPESLHHATRELVDEMCRTLEAKALGVRRLDLLFQRVDAQMQAIRIGTAKPSRDGNRLARLLTEHMDKVEPGFGVEEMRLRAPLVDGLDYRQADGLNASGSSDVSALIDTLSNRLGKQRIFRAAPVESDIPERSVGMVAPLAAPVGRDWSHGGPRPSRLLQRPEPVETMALLPDQPPVYFTWRGIRRRVIRADGPERIFGEWWKRDAETVAVRDYFAVEDESGERFWLFRAGDGEDLATGDFSWFIHGVFG